MLLYRHWYRKVGPSPFGNGLLALHSDEAKHYCNFFYLTLRLCRIKPSVCREARLICRVFEKQLQENLKNFHVVFERKIKSINYWQHPYFLIPHDEPEKFVCEVIRLQKYCLFRLIHSLDALEK